MTYLPTILFVACLSGALIHVGMTLRMDAYEVSIGRLPSSFMVKQLFVLALVYAVCLYTVFHIDTRTWYTVAAASLLCLLSPLACVAHRLPARWESIFEEACFASYWLLLAAYVTEWISPALHQLFSRS